MLHRTLNTSFNYHSFGSSMAGRSFSNSSYKYGFNTQEKTDEIAGEGNHTTALFWEYDTRLGRRCNLDPKPNSSISSFSSFVNNPIWITDYFGDTIVVNSNTKNKDGTNYIMFKLDNGKKELTTQTYDEFKKSGFQWYAKKEKKYASLVYLNPDLAKDKKAIGITSLEFGSKILEIRNKLHNSKSYKWFGWGKASIYNNFNHGEQGDIKAKGNLLDGFQLTVYTNTEGKQQLIRSDLLGNFVFGFMAQEHGQSFKTSKNQGDFLQAEGVDDNLDTYFLLLGHQQRQAGNFIPSLFNENAIIPK